MQTRSSPEIAIRSSMSMTEAAQALMKASAMGAPVQRLALEGNEIVVYLREPGLKDRLTMAMMPGQMRRDARSLVGLVLDEIARRDQVCKNSAKLTDVRETVMRAGSGLLEKSFLMQFEQGGDPVPF